MNINVPPPAAALGDPAIALEQDSAAAREAGLQLITRRLLLAGSIVLFVLPWVISDYRVFQFTLAYCYWIALFGQNLLVGYNGQSSLGHGAFYAVGAYTAAIAMVHFAVPYWLCIPLAAAVCFGAGVMVGLPSLRLSGHHLGLATFALAIALPQFLKFKPLEGWTGGHTGLSLQRPGPPELFDAIGLPIDTDRWLYYVALVLALVGVVLGRNLTLGRVGRAIVAIREHQLAAGATGINVAWYKTVTFGISAAYAGVGGALGGMVVQLVAPDSFTIFLSMSFIIGITVGGIGSITGPFVGALFIQFVPNIADEIGKAAPWAMYGLVLILVLYLAPDGVAGAANQLLRRVVIKAGARRG